MRTGYVDKITRRVISGWAADDSAPDARLELLVTVNGKHFAELVADRPRPDLAALGKYGDGAHGFNLTLADELPFEIDQTIVVRFADDGRHIPNGEQVLARESRKPRPPRGATAGAAVVESEDSGFSPVLVTAPSRSGTTYLMSCLAASPEIVAAGVMPYEMRLLDYYGAAHQVLSAAADLEKSTHPDRMAQEQYFIGFNPFTAAKYNAAFKNRAALFDLFDNWAPDRLGETMADIVREYYTRLAADMGKENLRYFAEKVINLTPRTRRFARKVFTRVHEIVLIRDPRDIMCSHIAYYGGRELEQSFHELTYSCKQLARMSDVMSDDMCIVRYEDMVGGGRTAFAEISKFLGVEIAPLNEERGAKMFREHATSTTQGDSIERWREDLPGVWRDRAAAEWGSFLLQFGYRLA